MIDENKFQKLFLQYNDQIDHKDNQNLDQFLLKFEYKKFIDYYLKMK